MLQTGAGLTVVISRQFIAPTLFALAAGADGQQILVCAEDSALISETAGAAFFDAQGNPDPAIQGVLDFLAQVQQNRAVTERICSALAQYGLIQPWPFSLQMEGATRQVEGLFRIDETALNALPAESPQALHQVGAGRWLTASFFDAASAAVG